MMRRRVRRQSHLNVVGVLTGICSVVMLACLYVIVDSLIDATYLLRKKQQSAMVGDSFLSNNGILAALSHDRTAVNVDWEKWRVKKREINSGSGTVVVDDSFVPGIAEMMTWGQGGSGVIIDSRKLLLSSVRWIPPRSVQKEIETGYTVYGLNEFVSNRISFRRSLPDMREPACHHPRPAGSDRKPLPDASVIIAFSTEPRSVLLRAVFSVLDRSPPKLLKEIILVDYGSTVEDLGYPQLEKYLRAISRKIIVVRLETTMNYAEAVNQGATTATGSKAVILSARCECTQNWLPPLLSWLVQSHTSIVVPIVDVIDGDTFRYERNPMSEVTHGSFSWDMTITRRKIQEREASSYHIPENTPIIADGIFAMDRKLFLSSGGFTHALSSRDLVHLEFSFKSWLCGESIQLIPCSRVGLVSLPSAGSLGDTESDVKEKVLVAHWWLGDFKDFATERLEFPPNTARANPDLTHSNIETPQHPARDSHVHFFDFRWFLEKLEPNKLLRDRVVGSGHLSQGVNLALTVIQQAGNKGVAKLMLKDNSKQSAKLARPSTSAQLPQFWYLTEDNQLQTEDNICLHSLNEDISSEEDNAAIHENSRSRAKSRQDIIGSRINNPMSDFLAVHGKKIWQAPNETILNSHENQRVVAENDTDPVDSSFLAVHCDFLPLRPRWTFIKGSLLLHIPTQKCLESQALSNNTYTLRLAVCVKNRKSQRWNFSHRLPFPQDQSILDMVTSKL